MSLPLLPKTNLALAGLITKIATSYEVANAAQRKIPIKTIDLSASIRAGALSGALSSNYISDLTADKITSGSITSQMITIGGTGGIAAGANVIINASGLNLTRISGAGSETSAPTATTFAVSAIDDSSALYFFEDTTNDLFGAALRADGNVLNTPDDHGNPNITGRPGSVYLAATYAGAIDAQAAVINLLAGADTSTPGQVSVTGNLLIGTSFVNSNAVSADRGNVDVTLTTADAPTQYFATPLTAARTLTLPTPGPTLINGMRFRVVRAALATGFFNLNIKDGTTTLKTLSASATWAEFDYNGASWAQTAAGSL